MLLSFFLISIAQDSGYSNPILAVPVLVGEGSLSRIDHVEQYSSETNNTLQNQTFGRIRKNKTPILIAAGLIGVSVTLGAIFGHHSEPATAIEADLCTKGWQFGSSVSENNPLAREFHALSSNTEDTNADPMTLVHDQLVNPEKASGTACQITTMALSMIPSKVQVGKQCTRRFYKSNSSAPPDEMIPLRCEPYAGVISYADKQVPGCFLASGPSGMSVPDGAIVFVHDRNGQTSIVSARAKTLRRPEAPPTVMPKTSAPKKLRTKTPKQTLSRSLIQTVSAEKTISPDTDSISISVSDEDSMSQSENKDTNTVPNSRTVTVDNIPSIAKGYEDIYKLFLGGRLIYTNPNNASDQIIMPISELPNPLNGTFNLSRCGDTGKYVQIATGYRTGYNPENNNKVEIWITPWFQIVENINTTAISFKPIMREWNQTLAPIGLFWFWYSRYDWLITKKMNEITLKNLYENWIDSGDRGLSGTGLWAAGYGARSSYFTLRY